MTLLLIPLHNIYLSEQYCRLNAKHNPGTPWCIKVIKSKNIGVEFFFWYNFVGVEWLALHTDGYRPARFLKKT